MTPPRAVPVRYVANFLSSHEARETHAQLTRTIPWEQKSLTIFGTSRLVPRLTCWFGDTTYTYSGVSNVPRAWTTELAAVRSAVEAEVGSGFNSCLANLYRDGSDSVGWHADNEPELGPRPIIASVSLGTARAFKLRHVESGVTHTLELAAGSLLVMQETCQVEWVHCVPKRPSLRGSRN